MRGEELDRLVHAHRQHLADASCPRKRTASVSRIEARAAAGLAGDLHVGQEAHLDLLHALAFAGLAAAARGVEREAARGRSRACALRWCRRTAGGSRPRSRRRSPGRSAASCRSASGRLRARARSAPSRRSSRQPNSAASLLRRCVAASSCAGSRSSTSRASVDLPVPETPVTTVSRPSGMRTSTFLQVVQARADARRCAACCASTGAARLQRMPRAGARGSGR